MRTRLLGRTGVTVSEYCLGAMMYGAMGNRDPDDCIRQIRTALDAGVNFVDTADVYSQGESEELVGRAIAGRRDEVVLATKFFGPMGDDPNRRGGSRRWIARAVEDSLRRLGTDHIDLFQCHRFPEDADPEETISALTDLQRAGTIRYWGTSSWPAERLVEAHWTAERRGLARPRCEQAPYNLLTRGIERSVLPTCDRYGMGVICYSPLAGSWLSGRYRDAADFEPDSRLVRFASRWGGFDPESEQNQRRLEVVRRCQSVADEAGLPLSHLAVAWTLEHPKVTSTIIGPRTGEQLDDLLAAASVRLDADVLDALDRIVAPGTNVNAGDPSSDPVTLQARHRRRPPAR
jgi:aryl-alcohol dehydrogenase-like predicted oxidoreductase